MMFVEQKLAVGQMMAVEQTQAAEQMTAVEQMMVAVQMTVVVQKLAVEENRAGRHPPAVEHISEAVANSFSASAAAVLPPLAVRIGRLPGTAAQFWASLLPWSSSAASA
jgi:hypothetical protein